MGEVKAEVENAPTLLIYGHYDVMPEGPLEMWDSVYGSTYFCYTNHPELY